MTKENRTPIVAIVGKRGNGKTLLMNYFILNDILEGMSVWANYHITPENLGTAYEKYSLQCARMTKEFLESFFVTKGEAFLKVNGGVLAIDELSTFADSYTSQGKNRLFIIFLLQTRKRNVKFYYTVQQFAQAQKRIRENTDLIVHPYYDKAKDEIIYDIFSYNYPVKEYIATKRISNISRYFPLYDTNEIIDIMGED